MRLEFVNEHPMDQPDETIPLDEQAMEQPIMERPTPTHNYQREMNTLRELINDMNMTEEITNVPTMRA
jgi:hypothetical protein